MTMPEFDLAAFRNEGYLLEANRQFFHPLGLALAIEFDDDECTQPTRMLVYDDRADAEGWYFGEITDAEREKASVIEMERESRRAVREEHLGAVVQPLDRTWT